MRPGRALITQMRLARKPASRRSWVTSSTVGRCSIQSSCRIDHSSSRVNWSSAPKGSSSSSMRGSWISARHRLARCSMPPESCHGKRRPKPFRPTCSSSALALSRNTVRLSFAELRAIGLDDLQRQHDVLLDRQPRQHGRVLERHADPQRLGRDFAAAEDDDAGRGLHQAARPAAGWSTCRSRTDRPARRIRRRRFADVVMASAGTARSPRPKVTETSDSSIATAGGFVRWKRTVGEAKGLVACAS